MAKKIVGTLSQSIVTEKHINEKKAARVWAGRREEPKNLAKGYLM
jgi:hypothetical protein